MSREVKKDFNELKEFIKGYNLSGLEGNKRLISIISQQHKKYFSLLTFAGEIINLKNDGIRPSICELQLDFLTESSSDIGNSIFVMIHGAYKPSRMMLRSSIENFLKAISLDEISNIHEEKSVYEIFDKVKSLTFLQNEPTKSIFNQIHQAYKELCQDTHTVSKVNMAHITSMKYFPAYNHDEAKKTNGIAIKLTTNFLVLLCIKYGAYFHVMHHRNKENILVAIPTEFKPTIQGIQ